MISVHAKPLLLSITAPIIADLAFGMAAPGRSPENYTSEARFRTATLDHIMCGRQDCESEKRRLGADLGLYSVTFNNDTERDRETLEAYKAGRHGGPGQLRPL